MTRNSVLKLLIVLCAFSSIAASPSPMTFAQASSAFDSQPVNGKTESYLNSWGEFNNSHKLDEKDGCYFKAPGPTRQILIIDASGTVVQFLSDVNNERTNCFRHSYLHVRFPKPPFAPFFVHMDMQ